MSEPELSVVLPVFDEARTLERSFAALLPALESLGRSWEIVCVDDGSRDESFTILTKLAAHHPRVRVERLPSNRGKGAALRKGVLAARGRAVVFMDADLSTDLQGLPELLEGLALHDLALGSRNAPGATIRLRQPWLRETLGKLFLALARGLFVPEIRDFTCGFKAFRASAAKRIFERARIDGWACDLELVVIAKALGLSIAQIPVTWRHEPGSKVRLAPAVASSLRDMARIRLRRAFGGYR